MRKISNFITALTVAVTLAGSFASASPALAASALDSTQKFGNWVVTDVAKNSAVEAFKVDRQLIAWTERSGDSRSLFAFNGVGVQRLATMPVSDWNESDSDKDFLDPIMGNFDAADGLVVWTQRDGHDREIYSWNGESVSRVSDNGYDDRHPMTSQGSIAWTSQPGLHYNLVVSKNGAASNIDSYHVMNYAFSGKNIFWMKFSVGDNTDKVYRYDGSTTVAVGIGDDRAMRNYFVVDGNGSAAWEYSTNRWNEGRRVMYNSYNGEQARSVIVRMAPPYATTLEDVDGSEIIMNSYDYYYQKLESRVSLIRSRGISENVVASKSALAKARFMDGGLVVRHAEPENGTALLKGGSQDFVSYDSVLYNMFEADGPTVAGAMSYGGLMIFNDLKLAKVPTTAKVTDLKVVNGDVAWIETASNGIKTLRFASRGVLVRTSNGPSFMGGHLVKTNAKSTVYFAAEDGKRYVFPSEKQFNTWYGDFTSVSVIPMQALSAKSLGGSVLFKPGSRLVKSATSPRVYMVGEDGMLHWVTSMSFIESIFGAHWNSKLDVMGDSLFVDYGIGLPVATGGDYRLALTK